MVKYLNVHVFAVLFLSTFLSGCAVVGAAYDIVTLPIVIVGEAAGGIADAVSGDDEDDKDDEEKSTDTKNDDTSYDNYDRYNNDLNDMHTEYEY